MEWLYDPVKMWTFFAALFVAVVVSSVVVFIGVRYLTSRLAVAIARRAPHKLLGWSPTWVSPIVEHHTAMKAYAKGNMPRALEASERMLAWLLERTRDTSCPWSLINSAVCGWPAWRALQLRPSTRSP